MGNASNVPQLRDDRAALRMDRRGDGAPAAKLIGAEDARRIPIPLCFGRDLCRFGNDEACGGTLLIVERHHRRGNLTRPGTIAGQGGHHDAIP